MLIEFSKYKNFLNALAFNVSLPLYMGGYVYGNAKVCWRLVAIMVNSSIVSEECLTLKTVSRRVLDCIYANCKQYVCCFGLGCLNWLGI